MSDYPSVVSFCEYPPGREQSKDREASVVWFPTSVAYYPREQVELGAGLVKGSLEQQT